jgi:hypothetical protein
MATRMIWSDLGQLTSAILLMIGALLPVVNPLGDAPIFLAMTPGCDELTRADLAKRIAFYSFILLLGSMLFGSFVLLLSGLSIPWVQVAGGASEEMINYPGRRWKWSFELLNPAHANSTTILPIFCPRKRPMKALTAWSIP